jgi:hypothetical protein
VLDGARLGLDHTLDHVLTLGFSVITELSRCQRPNNLGGSCHPIRRCVVKH